MNTTCSVCGEKVLARSLCQTHYNRWWRHGDPEFVSPGHEKGSTIEFRFWRKVTRAAGCWEWTGSTSGGYGNIRVGGAVIRAHRLAWELAHGPIPANTEVCHHCDNPACVKTEGDERWPDGHLFLGTHADNMTDLSLKGRADQLRYRRGSSHPLAKLAEADIPKIRMAAENGETAVSIGRRYGVTDVTISAILNRKTWRHL